MLKNGAFRLFNNIAVYSFRRRFCSVIQEGITKTAKNVSSKPEMKINVNAYFKEMDLRVGKIVEIEEMKDSENIYCCKIDLGENSLRDIGSGIRKLVKKEDLMNSQVIVFANLKPRKLGGFLSNGMILCASNENQLEVLRPPLEVANGEKIQLENEEKMEPEVIIETINDKKLKKYIPFFHVDDNYFCTYNGAKLIANNNFLKVKSLKNVKIC